MSNSQKKRTRQYVVGPGTGPGDTSTPVRISQRIPFTLTGGKNLPKSGSAKFDAVEAYKKRLKEKPRD